MEKTKIFTSILTIMLILSLSLLAANDSQASANIIVFGKQAKSLDIELSPPERLFHLDEDGYFFPGSPQITKKLEVVNVGDVPFRVCGFIAAFTDDVELAEGLQIEILELGAGKNEMPHLLYSGTLSSLSEGIEVTGKRAVPQRQSVTLELSVWMPETAGNKYQGLTTTADISVAVHFPPAK